MKKPFLDRRTMIKGVGVSLALPFFEAMWPVRGFSAETPSIPRRLGFVFFPNGAVMQKWTPKAEGANFELPPTLRPLAKVRKKINILSGLMHDNANNKGDGDGDHARSAASFLTGAHPRKQGDLHLGVSVDQIAATRIGNLTRLASLELGTEPNRKAGECDSDYSCAYSSNISWKSPSTPTAKEINPKLAFERMFGGKAKDRAEAAKRDFYRKSILDSAKGEADRLQKKLGQSDRRKLDEYLNNVREIERRISKSQTHPNQSPHAKVDLPPGIPADTDEHIRLMYDLMVIAYQTDTTRVATFMLANEGSDRKYEKVGIKEGHHILSHHQNKPDVMEQVQKIDQYLVVRFAAFLEKLNTISDGDGKLLDHTLIVYGCAISDGNTHNHNSLPVILAGGGGGQIKSGRHIVYPDRTPMNNLFLSMLDNVGAREERFGDSSGRLGQLDG